MDTSFINSYLCVHIDGYIVIEDYIIKFYIVMEGYVGLYCYIIYLESYLVISVIWRVILSYQYILHRLYCHISIYLEGYVGLYCCISYLEGYIVISVYNMGV
ncbi:hypothetical protein B484DRAFT_473449 [Ochromonadaceae sp. CCMP2298]|nr:hypothetical protein B484DRAFT_473449 [Ochromonadaceae sp. CCMP2298]